MQARRGESWILSAQSAMNFVLNVSLTFYEGACSSLFITLFSKGCDVDGEQTLAAVKQLHLESIIPPRPHFSTGMH